MVAWNRANVTFQYFEKSNPTQQLFCSTTVIVFGNTKSIVVEKIREIYPHWDGFRIVELTWE